MTHRQSIGRWGERFAEKYLIEVGCNVLERNLRTPYGEIDLICEDESQMIFIEVKTRTSTAFGFPEDAINSRKINHLQASAEYYMQTHPERGSSWRIDIISIQKLGKQSNEIKIEWFKNAVE